MNPRPKYKTKQPLRICINCLSVTEDENSKKPYDSGDNRKKVFERSHAQYGNQNEEDLLSCITY